MSVRILIGDVRERLKELPDASVHCCVTSPPYWGLRNYDTVGQLGLEPTLGEHIGTMVSVFREVRRVLRDDGVCWVNYGDCYATSPNGRSAAATKAAGTDDRTFRDKPFSTVGPVYEPDHENGDRRGSGPCKQHRNEGSNHRGRIVAGGYLKPKDLCMVPARFAIAMQDDGWWVRSTLPWVKRNGMPESISDRPATSIEYVFMFTKSARYWYDAEAIMLPTSPNTNLRVSQDVAQQIGSFRANGGAKTNGPMKAVVRSPKIQPDGTGIKNNESFINAVAGAVHERNFRNSDLFWPSLIGPLGLISDADGSPLALDVPPQPFSEAHFATFPPKLIEPLIRAGCPAGGIVLDPFGGAGTTGMVAQRHGRDAIIIELNPRYADIARRRIDRDMGMFSEVSVDEAVA